MISLFFFILGTAIGSFLNELIDRLPFEKSMMGRSHCDYCKKKLAWIDLIPVVSYFLIGGRCRYCKKKLSWKYPALELFTGVVFGFMSFYLLPSVDFFHLLLYLAIAACLIVIFFADVKYQIIPDETHIFLLILVLIMKIIDGATLFSLMFNVIEGVAVMTPILLLYLLTKGRGMGFGDVKLAFVMGWMMGVKMGLLSLYFGFIGGAFIGIALLLLKQKKLKSKIAFGPFIIGGIVLVISFQKEINAFIHKIYGV